MEIDFRIRDWENAQKVFDFYKQETTCFDERGLLRARPQYVVAMDDDMVSAYYAVYIAEVTYRQFHIRPKILCVGGIGMLSKYLNRLSDGPVMSEGSKLAMVARWLGNSYCSVLDKGNNTGANIKEVIDYLAFYEVFDAPIVFCLTQRLSKRVERTIAYSTTQFPGTRPLNAYYYVPGESLQDMCQLYNGKAIAGGLPLLSEAAALYDRMNRYAGVFMATIDKYTNKDIVTAGEELMRRYPIRVSRFPLSSPIQFGKMYFGLIKNRKAITDDLRTKVEEWKTLI
ncbi:MAG: hypothetical protein IJ677_02310 [Alphaproteobacteria bacterium]|nr:hypothetical protein [Alphaproteobacteria bacterium]